MHIYIISQYLKVYGEEDDRLYKLGKVWQSRGHEVTILTINKGFGLDLKGKKLGLLQLDGMALIAFNVEYKTEMSWLGKLLSYRKFAGLVEEQGKQLPKPDLIIASSPPLTVVTPALRLGEHYKTPVVLEVRELWPDAPIQRGSLKLGFLQRMAGKLEAEAYQKADRIIATGKGIADAAKMRGAEDKKVYIIPQGITEKELVESFDEALKGLSLRI